jgi:hypothetical protein
MQTVFWNLHRARMKSIPALPAIRHCAGGPGAAIPAQENRTNLNH